MKEFEYYHSMLKLDEIHLKVKYKRIFLTMIKVDANEFLFPFASIIMNIKNDEN